MEGAPVVYKKVKTIGVGANGHCYIVNAMQNKQQIGFAVLKEVDLNHLFEEGDKKGIEDAFKEAKHMEKLNHPNIIKFKEVYKTKKNKLHIVMELADNGDIFKHI